MCSGYDKCSVNRSDVAGSETDVRGFLCMQIITHIVMVVNSTCRKKHHQLNVYRQDVHLLTH